MLFFLFDKTFLAKGIELKFGERFQYDRSVKTGLQRPEDRHVSIEDRTVASGHSTKELASHIIIQLFGTSSWLLPVYAQDSFIRSTQIFLQECFLLSCFNPNGTV